MKLFASVCCCVVMSLCACAENVEVTRLALRQRWPFSTKVDVDFRVEGNEGADVSFTATWIGQTTPLSVPETALEGQTYGLCPGFHHLVLDIEAAGFGSGRLTNFRLQPSVVPASSRKYLLVNLISGGYSFLAEEPAGGFNSEENKAEYKYYHMVFRRVPAGTYVLGENQAVQDFLGIRDTDAFEGGGAMRRQRTVTISSDYYLAMYQVTRHQMIKLGHDTSGSYKPASVAVDDIRGGSLNGYDWPSDGYAVSTDSVIGNLRRLARLPAGMVVDLPTAAQWEVAARADAKTIYPNGGTLSSTGAELKAIREAESPYQSQEVGTKAANPWEFYDVLGLSYELVLDGSSNEDTSSPTLDNANHGTVDFSQTEDPVGPAHALGATYHYLACNVGWSWNNSHVTPSSRRSLLPSASNKVAVRPCIHLRRLVGTESK